MTQALIPAVLAPSAPALPTIPKGGVALGVGSDLVHVPAFVDQCLAVGSTFRTLFTPVEVRYAHRNCADLPGTPRIFGVPGAPSGPGGPTAPGGPRRAASPSALPFAEATAEVWGPHLAARWAAREAFIKAWSNALLGSPPVVEDSPELLAGISVTADQWGRPTLHLAPWVARVLQESCPGVTPLLSLSHDGDYAMAVVILSPSPADSP